MTPAARVPSAPEAGSIPRLAGALCPVLTPFGEAFAPDPSRLVAHCRWLLGQGLGGLALFGTTSEANSLSVEEREELLGAVLAAGIAPRALFVGTGSCALPDAVRLTQLAVRQGCAGVLMLPPFYYKGVSDDGLYRGFAEVIERVGDPRLRVYLYHIPAVAQVGFGPALIERLLRAYPGVVVGIKDSSGDWDHTHRLHQRFGTAGLQVFVGTERLLLANMRSGGAGCITAMANVNPAPIARLARQWQDPRAEDLQAELNVVRGAVERYPVIAALKTVLAHHAGDPAWLSLRPPLTELPAADAGALLADLGRRGFAMRGLQGPRDPDPPARSP
ncbi:MAG TPA: dihydrodipicolinate synthase family protein [Anaeromyxobacteraceae bacterium]|nr:dihydrodipicolinate synthase family protein [Anaeromyxobacteraceae bacterium]